MESISTYVERHALADILSPDLLSSIRLIVKGPGEHIIRKGEAATNLLFFVEGKAKVHTSMENGSSLLLRFYSPFDILGDVELFAYDSYFLDVVALTETACLAVGREAIKKAADRNSRLLMYLCGRLGSKLVESNSSAAINLLYPVENRLASYLLAMTEGPLPHTGLTLGTDNLVELAEILGTSYRQLSRVVRSFREAGILARERGRIRVLDPDRLLPLARDLYV
jgi:CRP-like cAMP-binding protein